MAEQKKLYAKENATVAEPEAPEKEKPIVEDRAPAVKPWEAKAEEKLARWSPKTELGKKVRAKEITDIRQVFDGHMKVREAEAIDILIPALGSDYIMIGQAHGKFGGGKRRIIKPTQKKTAEGNKPKFSALAVVGISDGFFGVGIGKGKESMSAKDKALRNAKRSITPVGRGCGSWKCNCGTPHSLPFEVDGRCGSVRIKLIPAPKGTGLMVEEELKKLMRLAGYKDMWSKSFGQTRRKINLVSAAVQALSKTISMRVKEGKVVYGPASK